jgi:mRNA interferase RelE/StbE
VAAYTIDVRPRARRSLRQLDPSVRKAVARVIDTLANDPQPSGFLPLTGHRPYLRVRSGDYRVIYSVDEGPPPERLTPRLLQPEAYVRCG